MPAGQQRTFYVLSGSNICGPGDNGGHWCGYAKGTPQSLLFSSTDLVNWQFKHVFWRGPFKAANGKVLHNGGSLYTPDTFELPDGRQVLIYLMAGTIWQIGRFDADKGVFTADGGNSSSGAEQGLGSCGQSLTDAKGRRVQFGWQHVGIPGANFTGAQSLPRVITAEPGGGLRFSPLPELATLHNTSTHLAKEFTPIAGASLLNFTMLEGVDQPTGLHNHIQLNITLSTKADAGVSLCVQCSDGGQGVVIEVQLSAVGARPALSATLGGAKQPLTLPAASIAAGSARVTADIFTDGAVIELFANGGEVALSHTVAVAHGHGVGYSASGAGGAVAMGLWQMQQSVFGAD